MKKSRRIIVVAVVLAIMASCFTIISSASVLNGSAGTTKTFINSSVSFSRGYRSDHNPTYEYRFKNLKCNNSNAKLSVTLSAKKIHWYNILSPSEYEVGTASCTSAINVTNGYWYGRTYHNIDCSSAQDLYDKFDDINNIDNLEYTYNISDNGGYNIYNSKDEWEIICSYE